SHTVYALTAAIDAKDSYTFAHSQNVADYAAILATAAGLSDEQIRIVYEAGLLHDIGKISIPESILTKPIILTEDEYEIMKSHVKSSIDMIRHLPSMDYVIPAAISHHERWDGKGYPRGISGDNIPVTGRCLAIADAFDAMTTSRAYRKALPIDYAIDQIEKGASEQFDPELAGLFVSLVRSGEINPNMQEKAPLASNE
ncbi:MAG: HD-GYP domain-containing protein, partial [Clostridiales bacterium]|nr:HD-GYP domain-containing protein [Clostridiales bacterium]